MSHYKEVEKFLDYIDVNISLPRYKKQVGGGNTEYTQPYSTFVSFSDKMFEYFKFIHGNNEKNVKLYEESVYDLENICDCEKYKCKHERMEEQEEDIPFEKPILLPPEDQEQETKTDERSSVLLLKGSDL
jgi:hypothetical protein